MQKTKKIVTCAIFSAVICAVTTFVSVPAPSIGNVNLGDSFILCSAWLLGPIGAIASAIGAFLADILSGYAIYAPATFIIKYTMSIACYYVFRISSKSKHNPIIPRLLSALCAEAIMVIGYFAYECIIFDLSSALSSVMFNSIQGTVCFVLGISIFQLDIKNKAIQDFSECFHKL